MVPVRSCVICNHKKERSALLRIMNEHSSGTVILEPHNKQFGRSIYLCKDGDCRSKFTKHKKYSKKFCIQGI